MHARVSIDNSQRCALIIIGILYPLERIIHLAAQCCDQCGVIITKTRHALILQSINLLERAAIIIATCKSPGIDEKCGNITLAPATAFYEFTGNASPQTGSRKTRWRFTLAGQPWFCLAGLWRRYPDRAERFTLLTTEPGPDMAPYHNRQVVVLPRERWADWLAGAPEADILKSGPAGSLKVVRDSPEPALPLTLPLFGGAS